MPHEADIRAIITQATRALKLTRVYLFGSRATAHARATSDIDLAFEHQSTDAEWAAFLNDMHDNAPTLLAMDLVSMASATPELKQRILLEGTLLYELA